MIRINDYNIDISKDLKSRVALVAQTYVDRRTQKKSDEFPPDYYLAVLNHKNQIDFLIQVNPYQLNDLKRDLNNLADLVKDIEPTPSYTRKDMSDHDE